MIPSPTTTQWARKKGKKDLMSHYTTPLICMLMKTLNFLLHYCHYHSHSNSQSVLAGCSNCVFPLFWERQWVRVAGVLLEETSTWIHELWRGWEGNCRFLSRRHCERWLGPWFALSSHSTFSWGFESKRGRKRRGGGAVKLKMDWSLCVSLPLFCLSPAFKHLYWQEYLRERIKSVKRFFIPHRKNKGEKTLFISTFFFPSQSFAFCFFVTSGGSTTVSGSFDTNTITETLILCHKSTAWFST